MIHDGSLSSGKAENHAVCPHLREQRGCNGCDFWLLTASISYDKTISEVEIIFQIQCALKMSYPPISHH